MAGVCIEGPSRGGLVFWKFYARGLGTTRFDFEDFGSVSNVWFRPKADIGVAQFDARPQTTHQSITQLRQFIDALTTRHNHFHSPFAGRSGRAV